MIHFINKNMAITNLVNIKNRGTWKYLVQFLAAVCQMLNKIIWGVKRDDFTTCLMHSFPKCWELRYF